MKPDYEKIMDLEGMPFSSKTIERNNRPLLSAAWHYHPEIEICLTKQSNGKRYVGNNISDYQEGDLVMFGTNLPHGFITTEKTKQIVIQIREDFLGDSLLNKMELHEVNRLFNQSKMGLEFIGTTKLKAQKIIKSISHKQGLKKLIGLLKLLQVLSNSKEYKTICYKTYSSSLSINQLSRMKLVLDFIENNYQQNITITDAAEVINLTNSAFYKFIKRHTKKKFTQLLNEYRINHASKMLINTQKTIAEICFDSGFKNLSYFNRKFKAALKESPGTFRAKFI